MDGDPVLHVKELMLKKERIENEIKEYHNILQSQNVGMKDELVDKDGFPRSDIDVHAVRIARNKIICLRNDFNEVMKEIELGLHEVHASAKEKKNQGRDEAASETNGNEEKEFLKVDLVSSGSPAEKSGLKFGDLIIRFGTITDSNFNGLPAIGSLVQHSKGKPLQLVVKRDSTVMHLTLTPNTWSGRGLLGCNIVIIK